MNKTVRVVLLLVLMLALILTAPYYMSHLLGGITVGLFALGVIAFAGIAALGALLVGAAGLLVGFLVACIVVLALLSPVILPLALLGGFIWLIVKLASPRPTPPATPSAPAAPSATA